jgi:hypothetical protein
MKPWTLEALWALIVKLVGVLVILYGFGVFGYQVLLWLQEGVWTSFELRSEWAWLWGVIGLPGPEPEFSWLGVQRITLWLLGSPLSLGLIVTGITILVFGLKLEAKVNAMKAEYKRVTGLN